MLLKTQKIVVVLLILFSAQLWAETKPVAPENIPGAITVSAEEVIELILINSDLIVVDSRKKTEYAKGHIEGSVNLLNTDMNQQSLEVIAQDKTKPILFYCNGVRCLRSSDAVAKALDWGYKNIFWFRGGWNEWMEKRLPVISD
ncbi:MAG: rhodanese-like domain-containing protein [Gammaproteobacteria bacterium]|nr:rhodanese-like domain-containing protein [Gammaproteobacteria bacterium]MCK5262033.1 rhodanese-like domain-containing protein [Gammaproteobacteria bacterium]